MVATKRSKSIDVPNEQRKVPRIEHLHIRNASIRNDPDLTPKDIQQANQNESISNQSRRAQLREVADKRQRQEDDQLHEDEVWHRDELEAVGDTEDERLKVLRNEDGVCRHKSDLGHDN